MPYSGSPTLSHQLPDLVAAQGVAGVNPDADDISRSDLLGLKGFKSFIRNYRIAIGTGCGDGENIQPAGRNHSHAKRYIARIDRVNSHKGIFIGQ